MEKMSAGECEAISSAIHSSDALYPSFFTPTPLLLPSLSVSLHSSSPHMTGCLPIPSSLCPVLTVFVTPPSQDLAAAVLNRARTRQRRTLLAVRAFP